MTEATAFACIAGDASRELAADSLGELQGSPSAFAESVPDVVGSVPASPEE